MLKYSSFLALLLLLVACEPQEDEFGELPGLPGAPTLSVQVLEDDPNFVRIEDTSTDYFNRVWELPGGTPNRSSERVDTILYREKGTYEITLHGVANNGAGNTTATGSVTIETDATIACDETTELLVGGCAAGDVKCWTFSRAAGAVTVGPVPGSGEWFTSNADGLQDEQYDDGFCFYFEGARFQYENNGLTVDPYNGYAALPFDAPTDHTFLLIPNGGPNGEMRIELTEGSFLGLLDASNVYDVVTLTETELVVRTPIRDADEGWFELYFVAQ